MSWLVCWIYWHTVLLDILTHFHWIYWHAVPLDILTQCSVGYTDTLFSVSQTAPSLGCDHFLSHFSIYHSTLLLKPSQFQSNEQHTNSHSALVYMTHTSALLACYTVPLSISSNPTTWLRGRGNLKTRTDVSTFYFSLTYFSLKMYVLVWMWPLAIEYIAWIHMFCSYPSIPELFDWLRRRAVRSWLS